MSDEVVQDEDCEFYIVDAIMDVKILEGEIKYRTRWQGYPPEDDSWEPESIFRYEPVLSVMMDDFQEKYKEKLTALKEECKLAKQKKKSGRRTKRKTFEYIPEEKSSENLLVSREPQANDEFYGTTVADATGELKKLIDPSHKNSPTELLLAQMNSVSRVTRRQMRGILPETPSSSVTPAHSRASTRTLDPDSDSEVTPRRNPKRPLVKDLRDIFETEEDSDDIIEVFSSFKRPPQNRIKENSPTEKNVNESPEIDIQTKEELFHEEPLPSVSRESPIVSEDIQINWSNFSNSLSSLASIFISKTNNTTVTLEEILNTIRKGDCRQFKSLIPLIKQNKEFYKWTDKEHGFTFYHVLCTGVKCNENHDADDILNLLFEEPIFGDIINYQEKNQLYTALHFAVEMGAICRVQRLLSFKCFINFPDRKGLTPLRVAYMKNHAKMTKLLLQTGATFAQLELEEKRKAPDDRKKRAYEVLARHAEGIRNLLTMTRHKLFRNLVDAYGNTFQCPIMTAPCYEGPHFNFPYYLPPLDIPNDTYIFLLFLFICRFENNDSSKWTARCWPGLHVRCEVNGCTLEPVQRSTHPMVYFATPFVTGENSLRIDFLDKEDMDNDVLAAQVVLVKRSEEVLNYAAPTWSFNSGLETAPLVGPYM